MLIFVVAVAFGGKCWRLVSVVLLLVQRRAVYNDNSMLLLTLKLTVEPSHVLMD